MQGLDVPSEDIIPLAKEDHPEQGHDCAGVQPHPVAQLATTQTHHLQDQLELAVEEVHQEGHEN